MQANMTEPAQRRVTRRDAIKPLGVAALLAAGLWPGALRAAGQGSGARFRFVAVNDTHVMTPECGTWLGGVVRQMKAETPEFCLHCGDVTEKGELENLELTRAVFNKLEKPTYPVIGNHDYLTTESRTSYEKVFPERINYQFSHDGWQFIGLDSSEGQKYENTSIQPATFQWLEENLRRLNQSQPTVLFTHFPLGADVKYRPLNADALLERFLDFNLQAVFCGHYHAFTERVSKQCKLTTNRCCALKRGNHDGTKEKGYFVCDVSDGRITRRFVEYVPSAKE
jgi:3',5'-cyclic AMP phosphodiesterase CpdA